MLLLSFSVMKRRREFESFKGSHFWSEVRAITAKVRLDEGASGWPRPTRSSGTRSGSRLGESLTKNVSGPPFPSCMFLLLPLLRQKRGKNKRKKRQRRSTNKQTNQQTEFVRTHQWLLFLFLELEKKFREKTYIFCHWQFVFFLSLRFFWRMERSGPKVFFE